MFGFAKQSYTLDNLRSAVFSAEALRISGSYLPFRNAAELSIHLARTATLSPEFFEFQFELSIQLTTSNKATR